MLVTHLLLGGGLQPARAGLLVSVFGLLVTSCGMRPSIEDLVAVGGHSEPGSTAGADGQGRLLVAAAGRGSGGAGADGPAPPDVVTGTPAAGNGAGGAAFGNALDHERYPGQGFIVHEWGTDTIVVGSDGSLQRGLHHEEEDLPAFVYDRIKAGTLLGVEPSVTIKMETPVTYFYSPTPLLVNVRVEFPKGVLTQWYPGVISFLPGVAAAGSVTYPSIPEALLDPVLDPSFPFVSDMCRVKHGLLTGGLLDWGNFSLRARGVSPEKPLPSAPLDQFGWDYARAVDANLLGLPNGEIERFLFYRGLGEFELPVKVQAADAAKIKLTNNYSEAVGQVFVLNVNQEHGAFAAHSAGIAPGVTLEDTVPSLEGAPSVEQFAAELAAAVTKALDATGLYHDEAVAMVNTWRRQWFRTPGVRALYLAPQSWTEQSIPLRIGPKPDATLRVMLIRVELITKEQESEDVSALSSFDTDAARGATYFSKLGRFAEPRLRRALQLSPRVAGEQYLSQIASVKSSVMSGE